MTIKNQINNIDKNVIMLGWVSFFTDMASAMVNPILPIFVVSILHEGYDKLGFIVAIATFVSYALRLISGYISDRYGIVKPLVVGGYALSAVSKPVLAISDSWRSVALLRGVERVGKGIRSAPKDLLISKYAKSREEGKTFGFHKSLDIAGELSGTLLLFGLLALWGESEQNIRTIFTLTLIPGLIALVIVTFFVKDAPKKENLNLKLSITKEDKRVIKTLIFYFIFIFFIFSDAFFTIRATDVKIETFWIPLLFVVSALTQTLISFPVGYLIDKIGYFKVSALAYLSGLIAQILLLYGTRLSIWIAFAFLGIFTVTTLNANRALIAQSASNKGSVYGIFYAGVALFGAIGAMILGLLWEHFGSQSALLFSLMGVSFVLVVYLFRGDRGSCKLV
jgi:MFS family permease